MVRNIADNWGALAVPLLPQEPSKLPAHSASTASVLTVEKYIFYIRILDPILSLYF